MVVFICKKTQHIFLLLQVRGGTNVAWPIASWTGHSTSLPVKCVWRCSQHSRSGVMRPGWSSRRLVRVLPTSVWPSLKGNITMGQGMHLMDQVRESSHITITFYFLVKEFLLFFYNCFVVHFWVFKSKRNIQSIIKESNIYSLMPFYRRCFTTQPIISQNRLHILLDSVMQHTKYKLLNPLRSFCWINTFVDQELPSSQRNNLKYNLSLNQR